MTVTAVFNAILGLGVVVVVVAPLVWAILTQHRDHPRLAAATDGGSVSSSHRLDRRREATPAPNGVERRAGADRRVRGPRPQYKPVAGRA